MDDIPLCRALVSFIYERRAIKSINNNRIFQSFLECQKYRHLAIDRNNVELMMLFHDEVLPNLHQFVYSNPEELAYYEEYNYDQGFGPILRHAMSNSQRYPLDAELSQDTNVSDSPIVRAITANNLRDSLLATKKQQSNNIHPAYICASFFVATEDERSVGDLLPKPVVRKRLLELRTGERARTNDDQISPIDYGLLVHNKKRREEGLPLLILNVTAETSKSVTNQSSSITTPNPSPAPTGPAAPLRVGMNFVTVDDFEDSDAVIHHINNLARTSNTSTPIRPPVQHRQWSSSPIRSRKRVSSLKNPKLGQKFSKNKSRGRFSQSLESIPEHIVIKVREKERQRNAAKTSSQTEPLVHFSASVSQSDSSTSESLEQLPNSSTFEGIEQLLMPPSQCESSISESLEQLPIAVSQSDASMSE